MRPLDFLLDRVLSSRLDALLRQAIQEHERQRTHLGDQQLLYDHLVHGDRSRLRIHPTAVVNNALFNVSSGRITVGEYAFFGHNVCVLTGTHDVKKFGEERQKSIPREGRDIVIGDGAWLGSNVTVLGPCTIGEHAVVGACSMVDDDVEPYTVVVGSPAKPRRRLDEPEPS